MRFSFLKKSCLLLISIGLLCGCSKSEWKKGTTGFFQDVAHDVAKNDCEIYKRGTSQYEECFNQVDTFYKENYSRDTVY